MNSIPFKKFFKFLLKVIEQFIFYGFLFSLAYLLKLTIPFFNNTEIKIHIIFLIVIIPFTFIVIFLKWLHYESYSAVLGKPPFKLIELDFFSPFVSRNIIFITSLFLFIVSYDQAKTLFQILNGEVSTSRLLSTTWVTIGRLYFHDKSFLGYIATAWSFGVGIFILLIMLMFYIFYSNSFKLVHEINWTPIILSVGLA